MLIHNYVDLRIFKRTYILYNVVICWQLDVIRCEPEYIFYHVKQGCGIGFVKSQRFLGESEPESVFVFHFRWSRSLFLNFWWSRSRWFSNTRSRSLFFTRDSAVWCADRMATDKMSNRQNVEQTKCRTDKMSTDKMPNRQNVDRQNVERKNVDI